MPGSIFLKNNRFCVKSITDYMDPYFKLKPPDCYLYAEDGYKFDIHRVCLKVSLLGVDSLWGDCTFIPADWGS